jgi:hypothetical protein
VIITVMKNNNCKYSQYIGVDTVPAVMPRRLLIRTVSEKGPLAFNETPND